ncbi:MAG: hypothetical protein JTJ30_05260 [Catenibacterium mitsuokai]|nr:hypothetical protein [Catenibacterium mitsuokai]MBN2931385.1 hypothetical protein [Catenibacterium mitsuokai]
MEMNLFMGAVIDMPNSKASRILKKFCEPFIGAEFVIHSNLYEDSYKTSYEKIADSKTIKHVIHFNCDDEKLFDLSFELIKGKNEFQVMAGGTVVEDDGVIKVIKALSTSILWDLGVVIDEHDEALDNFEMCYSLYDMEDIDDDKLKEIFTKILQPIFQISKIYGALNAINVTRFNVSVDRDMVKIFQNDGNMIAISPKDIIVSKEIFEDPNYIDYLNKMANEISIYTNALIKTTKKPVAANLTEEQHSKLGSIIKNIITPELIESIDVRPGQDPVFVDEDDKNYIYVQGPTNKNSVVVLGIKSKITGKIFILNVSIDRIYCFLFDEKINKNGDVTLKGVSKLDDELFKDLEDYAETCKIKNSDIILGTSEIKKTLLS